MAQGGGNVDPQALAKQAEDLRGELVKLTEEVKQVKQAAHEAQELAKKTDADLRKEVQTANKAAGSARRDAVEAKQLAAAADAKVTQAKEDLAEIKAALANDPHAGPLPAPVKVPPFLTLALRDVEFDPIAQRALERVAAAARQATDPVKLGERIVAKGVATAIGKVSQTLGRTRMTETRRHILAATYPRLLDVRLGDPIANDLANDPVGLAQSLLADLEANNGPLDSFAEAVVAGSEATMRLDLKAQERTALRARVRASL